MGTTRLACAAGVLLTLGAMGCAPSLGECDPVKAKQVVFLDQGPNNPANGLPMYAGQALMQLSCGNGGFCHSAAANGDARYGAPAGLDFDVSVACPVGGACEGDAITRLARNQHRVFKDREDILRVLDNRTMPPGKVGREVRARAGNYVSLTIQPGYIGGVDGGQKLPEIRSADGRDIVRNWLACGAPVVERVETPDDPRETGKDCTGDMSVVGDCRLRAPTLVMPEPNWDSIYDTVIEPLCVSCHGPDDSTSLAQSKLDLSDRDAAYDALVGKPAIGDKCDGKGTLVVAGDSAASLLVDKIDTPNPSCGAVMPVGIGPLVGQIVDPIRAWIDAGAQR